MADETELPRTVGYKRPPVEHRFRKGQSGNPKGRPRKSPASPIRRDARFPGLNTDAVLLEEAYRSIQVREGDEVKIMPALAAVHRTLTTAAMKGDRFARELLTRLVHDAEARTQAELLKTIEAIVIYKEGCYAAFRAADARGAPRPELGPHPDDLVIGADGMPDFVGPFDEAEKTAWDEARCLVAAADEEIAASRRAAARNPNRAVSCHNDIMQAERLRRGLDFMLPDEVTRRRPGYRMPTIEAIRAYRAELVKRYRPFAKLSADEQEKALSELVPAKRRSRTKAPT